MKSTLDNKLNNGYFKKIFLNLINFLDKYYFILIGLYFLYKAIVISFVNTGIDYKASFYIMALAAFTAYKEVRRDVKWIPFLFISIPLLIFIKLANTYGYGFWSQILNWQMSKQVVIDLNPIFRQIPFNDAAFIRVYKPETLTWFMRLVYANGFVLPVLIPIYRSAICKDFKKMLTYTFSAHVFQIFLISPFYRTFHLQEVWYVLGHPDGMARNLSPEAAAGWTLNCFPSMHTSIAFAMFLLVLREKDLIFKWVWGFFCLSVIFSTMYLEIHWIIDVIGGLILAYVTVKLADWVVSKLEIFFKNHFSNLYYTSSKSTFIKNYYTDTL